MQSSTLHRYQEHMFDAIIHVSYLLILFSALGWSQSAPKYLENLDYYVRVYICLFLMWRFHPFRKYYTFTELDRKIAFSAGAFILTTTALNEYLEQFKQNLRALVHLS